MPADAPDSLEVRLRQRESMLNHPLQTQPQLEAITPQGGLPNTPLVVSVISFLLGGVFAIGILTFVVGGFGSWWSTYQLGFFVAAWAGFHWGEFVVTAGWNLEKCSVDSFLLNNGSTYHIANGTALVEYLLVLYFNPTLKSYPYVSELGIIIVIAGQFLRSITMIHASTNFSHSVAFRKRESHKLVTDGVYAWFRHPSYAGFFYWALGTQLVLQNPVTCVLFAILLWKFFYYRTRAEEASLIKFFGDDYVRYRNNVGTKIPFVP